MKNWITDINNLRLRLPSAKRNNGKPEPKALTKLANEMFEFMTENDPDEKMTEVPDMIYYAAGAAIAGLISFEQANQWLEDIAHIAGLSKLQALAATKAKYGFRAQEGNPKNKSLEKQLILRAIKNYQASGF